MPGEDDFIEVWQEQRVALVRLAYVLTGDRQAAEDAVGDAVEKVLPKVRAGRVDDVRRYLRRAVVNQTLRRGRRRAVEERHPPEPVGPIGDHTDSADDRDLLWTILRALAVEQRAVVVLRFYLDLSEADTAALLDVRPGTVKSRTARALERLRSALEEVSST
jgi:RNA polymerase sigma-70 factor, ECF subfamily